MEEVAQTLPRLLVEAYDAADLKRARELRSQGLSKLYVDKPAISLLGPLRLTAIQKGISPRGLAVRVIAF